MNTLSWGKTRDMMPRVSDERIKECQESVHPAEYHPDRGLVCHLDNHQDSARQGLNFLVATFQKGRQWLQGGGY